MRVALIQTDARIGRNSFSIARALRSRGHEATLLSPQIEGTPSTPTFVPEWRAEGFDWIPVAAARLESPPHHFPRDRAFATARRLSELTTAFDIAWFFERHWAMPTLRERKFRDRLLPLVVLDDEPDPEPIPVSLDDSNRAGMQAYALQWADLICSGRELDAACSVSRVEEAWRERISAPARHVRASVTSPAVTVCVPYFESPTLLPETLRSLECQTSSNFTVVVVDDGSHTEEARRSFDDCAERYRPRQWKFVRQSNRFPGAARNRAAREAETEFLMFLDADDIAMPPMVERFLRAALLTGDDFLVLPNYGFRDDPEGPCENLYDPPGNCLIGSMADNMHGGACIFARRESFWFVGGFRETPGIGSEDHEFHVRCNLQGMLWDVLPEFHYRYRMPRVGGVSQSTSSYGNQAGVLRLYENRLHGSGLIQLPLALASAFWRCEDRRLEASALRYGLAPRSAKLSRQRGPLRLLLLTCQFPFGSMSGWHARVQQIIRFFGSRYELTLVTPMTREEIAPARKKAFLHLNSVRGIECGKARSISGGDLPLLVRHHYTETAQSAVRSLPTGEYHAALIDQIFMAEFRKDIETVAVLFEHNIESRLLRQVAGRSWSDSLTENFQDAPVEAARLEQYENRAWPDFPLRSVVSEVDKAQMDRRVNSGKTVVAPNGADPSSWLPSVRYDAATVFFPGHLSYIPNVDAVNLLLTALWPRLRKRKPEARLILAGRDPLKA